MALIEITIIIKYTKVTSHKRFLIRDSGQALCSQLWGGTDKGEPLCNKIASFQTSFQTDFSPIDQAFVKMRENRPRKEAFAQQLEISLDV